MLAWQLPWASGNDWLGVIIFLIFVFGSFIAQMVKKAKGESEDEPTPMPRRSAPPAQQQPVQPPRPSPQAQQSEEIRKFLEALGRPRTAIPPAPPVLRPVQPQIPRRPPPAPPTPRRPVPQPPLVREPLVTAPVEGTSEEAEEGPPRNIITGESTRAEFKPLSQVDVTQEMKAVETEVEHAPRLSPTAVPAVAQSRALQFAALLADHSNVRRAVVLAEIIGAPKAFR